MAESFYPMAKLEIPNRAHSCRTKPSISLLTGPKTAIRAQNIEQPFGTKIPFPDTKEPFQIPRNRGNMRMRPHPLTRRDQIRDRRSRGILSPRSLDDGRGSHAPRARSLAAEPHPSDTRVAGHQPDTDHGHWQKVINTSGRTVRSNDGVVCEQRKHALATRENIYFSAAGRHGPAAYTDWAAEGTRRSRPGCL